MGKKRRLPEVSGHLLSGSLLGQPVTRTLDLHGKTTAEARRMVTDFILTTSRGASGRVVRIITGKGTRSARQAVLRPLVRHWLETDLARFLEAISPDTDGGSYLVRLK